MDLLESHRFPDDFKANDVITSFKVKPSFVTDENYYSINASHSRTNLKESEKQILLSAANNKLFVTPNVDNGLRFGINSTLNDAADTYPVGPKTSEMGREINQLAAEATFSHWRWPPYVLVLSAAVVVLSHALHCALVMLATALPYLRKFSTFLWNRSEERLENIMAGHIAERALTVLMCLATFVACLTFYVAYAAYALLLWLVQPLWTQGDPQTTIHNNHSFDKVTSETTNNNKEKVERIMEKSISNYQT